jgi:hypothetical protein
LQLVQCVEEDPNILQTGIQPLAVERLYSIGSIANDDHIRVLLLRAFDVHYGHMRIGDELGLQ